MGALARLGDIGISSVSVIHQPRHAVFVQFDTLFLLGKGGQMVYQGAPEASLEYFSNLGFEMKPNDNLADFVCDGNRVQERGRGKLICYKKRKHRFQNKTKRDFFEALPHLQLEVQEVDC